MKKTIFATLALGTAITFGGIATNEASADEIDYNKLAEQAKSNSAEVNTKPIQAGNYDFSFSDGEFTYHFYNYNGNFGYEYHSGSTQVDNTVSRLAGEEQTPEQKVDQQQAQFDTQNKQDTKKEVQTTSAPVQKETKQPTQSTSSTGGSVKAQFLQAGGTEAMWNSIVMPESTGNPNATNGQYSGLFQMSPQSGNGTGSVAEQTKSAIKYANERYGSVENAISERQSKGWW
ncbi:transglycosylase [Staphylococcus phage JD007]|uniref:Immunodominant antigen a n=1 Tax=Staphylococcus phage JD007 TaxID=1239383 RepID=K7QMG8_9CAUD|nr:transglycosylase [Staphylococcus phage JD007]AFV50734.1 immunodominant antigen a [Staphylococcus phage JD007]